MSKELPTDPSIHILKSGVCSSLSGKAKLSYQIGCKDDADLQLRVTANNSGGFFSKEWIPVAAIQKIVQSKAAQAGLTSTTFRSIFKGKSVNSAGFLLAALVNEGVIRPQGEKSRSYEVADLDGFLAAMVALMQPGADKPGAPKGRAGAPAKRVSTKKA